MIYATVEVIGSDEMEVMAFADEDALIRYQIEMADRDVVRKLTPSGIRMQRKRRREQAAAMFWTLRIRTGVINLSLIADALEHAPAIVETARLRKIRKLKAWAAAYPERCEPVTK